MVRNYKRKHPKQDEQTLQKAIEEIKDGQRPAVVGQKYEIPRGILRSRMKLNGVIRGAATASRKSKHHKQVSNC